MARHGYGTENTTHHSRQTTLKGLHESFLEGFVLFSICQYLNELVSVVVALLEVQFKTVISFTYALIKSCPIISLLHL